MGGGFMADNKDMTTQQQIINKQKKKLQQQHQQQDPPRHSHQALSVNPNHNPNPKFPSPLPSPASPAPPPGFKRKTPEPPTSITTSSPPPRPTSILAKHHKKKLLKVILKVPHSSPSPSSSPSSPPLSRPSPHTHTLTHTRTPPFSPPSLSLTQPPHHHHHHHHLSPSPPSPSPSPSPSASPSSPTSSSQPPPHHHPPKLTAELQQFHHLQRPSSKPPLQPPVQQIKHPPPDPRHHLQHLHKKSHHLRQVHQKGDNSSPNPKLEQANPNRQQSQVQTPSNSSRSKPQQRLQQEEYTPIPSKFRHKEDQANPIHANRAEQEDLANSSGIQQEDRASPSRTKWPEQEYQASQGRNKRIERHDQTNPSHVKRKEQLDETNYRHPKWSELVDPANSCRPTRVEQVDEGNHSSVKRTETANPCRTKQTEQLDLSHSRTKRLEVRQLEEEATLKRPQRHQEQQEEQHTGPYPKRLRPLHQSQQEQTNQVLGNPKVQQAKLPQISSQPQPLKKLTQNSVQGPHGLHSPKIPPLPIQSPSPHPFPPSTPASLQSSAPSLSTSALSDEAQKPSKKRRLRSLLEPEGTDGHSVAAYCIKEQPQDASSTPAATPVADSPVVKPRFESHASKECAAASSSPKTNLHGPHLVPAKKLLKGILDRLQKKDRFGVFAEPVDPKEVPNYYDIIKDPMDFGTMRNRISSGHYTYIESFQKDIFLICDNAMKYNGKGTVYFRHARSIKDIAERILEDLKVSGVSMEMDEPTTKQKNGGSGKFPEKNDSCMYTGSPSETRVDNLDDFSGYLFRTTGIFDGRRSQAFDENRRTTYMPLSAPFQGNDSLLTTISGDSAYFVPTGYQMDFPYAKSLARFAADLGPSVWRIAEEKIRRALPPGFPFGPGWVGEREAPGAPGGIVLASSMKQQWQGRSIVQPTAKLLNENGAVTAITTGNFPAIQPKLDNQSHIHAGNPQENSESVMKLDHHPGMQASLQAAVKPPNEVRSPMVFGNSLVHNGRSDRLDQQVLMQPAVQPFTRLHNCEVTRPPGQGGSLVNQEGTLKLDQPSGGACNKAKFSTQVNLNHPISFQPEELGTFDDRVSKIDSITKGKDDRESKTKVILPESVPESAVIPVTNAGGLLYEGNPIKGGAYTSRAPQMDMVNPMRGTNGEAGLAGSTTRNQFDSRASTQLSRINSLNESPRTEASSNATNIAKNNVFHHYENFHSSRGSLLPHNLNVPVQQPTGSSRVGLDVNLGDSMRSSSSHSQSTQGLTLPRNLNMPGQQACTSQQPISSNHVGSQDASPVEPGLSIQAPFERAMGERGRESGEKEIFNSVNRTPTGAASSLMPKKGFIPERSFMMHQLESRNGQGSDHDLANANIHSLDQLNRKQNANVGIAASSFPPGLPTSNGASRVREESRLPGWVPAQQPDSIPVTGKGGMPGWVPAQQPESNPVTGKGGMNQVLRNSTEHHEISPRNAAKPQVMRSASKQLQGVQGPQIFGYGNQKHVSNVPHFLQQQQFGSDTQLPIHHQQMQLHLQGNSMVAGAQNPAPSDSRDSKFVRQFQLPSHRVGGFPLVGNQAWQYMPQQMVSQGPHQHFAAAPDLNVSLPLTKSSFDQPNGTDIQQPDLALQL